MIRRSALRRRKPERMMPPKEGAPISCRPHLQWVAGHYCCIAGRVAIEGPMKGQQHVCEGRIDPHHVKTRGAGGGDEQVAPLCRLAHSQLDSPGWSQPLFERAYSIDLANIAADLWKRSPHGQRYRNEQRQREGGR